MEGVVGGPDLDLAVFAGRKQDGQRGVGEQGDYVVRVVGQREDRLFGLVVPNADGLVVGPRKQVGLFAFQKLHAVDCTLVARQSCLGLLEVEVPNFDGLVEGGGGDDVGVFVGEADLHHEVSVLEESLGLHQLGVFYQPQL